MLNKLVTLHGQLVVVPGKNAPTPCWASADNHSLSAFFDTLSLDDSRNEYQIAGKYTKVTSEKIQKKRCAKYFIESEYSEEWKHRRYLISQLVSKLVVGGSIVPTDPYKKQTWYIKLTKEEDTAIKASEIFTSTVGELQEEGTKPPLLGFIPPFPSYDNSKYPIDTRPGMSVPKTNAADPEKKEACLRGFKNQKSQEKCQKIWMHFLNDPHSKELAFTIIDNQDLTSPIKRIHLTK